MSESRSLNSVRVPFRILSFGGSCKIKCCLGWPGGMPPRKILGSLRLTKSKITPRTAFFF